jgi:hypothetical protein
MLDKPQIWYDDGYFQRLHPSLNTRLINKVAQFGAIKRELETADGIGPEWWVIF